MQRLSQHAPTQHPTSEELSGSRAVSGGRDYYAKVYWLHVSKALEHQLPSLIRRPAASFSFTHICIHPPCLQVDAVVYMVDAADGTRFGESKAELGALLSDDALAGVPFLVLGNKIDIPQAAPEHALAYYLGLAGCTTGKGTVDLAGTGVRPIEVFMCSVVRKMGYGEG